MVVSKILNNQKVTGEFPQGELAAKKTFDQTAEKVSFIATVLSQLHAERGGYVMGNVLLDTLQEALRLLESKSVEFAIAGGYAVSHYSKPRATDDLDLVVSGNVEELESLLVSAGFENCGVYNLEGGFTIYKLKKNGVEVDFLELPPAFQASVLSRRTTEKLLSIPVGMVSLEDLILMKLVSYRQEQDQLDLKNLVKENPAWDQIYVKEWVEKLKIPKDRLEILTSSP